MVPRRRNARATQTLQHSREPESGLGRVYVSGPITALAAALHRRKVRIYGRRTTSGPRGGRKEGPQGRNGSVNPLALRRRETITEPLLRPPPI